MGARPVVAVLAFVLAVVVLTGCAGVPSVAGPSVGEASAAASAVQSLPVVPGIGGEVVRLRSDEAAGTQVQVRLTATGAQGFTVTGVALRSPAFAPLAATAEDTDYLPGRTVDLPVPFGAVDCAAPVQPVAAVLDLDRGAGPEQVVVPLAGTAMELVAGELCAAQRLAEHVGVAVEGFTPDGDGVTGEVVLTRVDDADVVVTALGRSVLLTLAPSDLPARLDGEDLRLPLRVQLASCDPHVLAETKKPFVFPLTVQVDGVPAAVDLPLDDAQRAELQHLVDRVCG